jgi:hypothetical protein
MEDDLKKNRRRPQKKWKMTSKTKKSTKINLIGCDTIVNSPSPELKILFILTVSIVKLIL